MIFLSTIMKLKPSSLEKSTNIYFSLLMLTQDRVMGTQALLIANLWLKIALKQNGLLRACCKSHSISIIGSLI